MRQMATVRKIDEIRPIENADSIEAAVIGGWVVVVKKGEFKANELAVYLEIDSWVPHGLAPFLSRGNEPREFNGIKGERLRTVKLRGQISQGLLLPLTVLPHSLGFQYAKPDGAANGEDVSHWLGIQKWEAPIPAQLAGQVRGNFPSFIPKTDQERIQNCAKYINQWKENRVHWEITEKLDGSSMTVYVKGDNFGVCSRNLDLKEESSTAFWLTARKDSLIDKIQSTGRNLAFQGELIGNGIQKNPYDINGNEFYLFDIYDIDAAKYLLPDERQDLAKKLNVNHVPIIGHAKFDDIADVFSLLQNAEGKSFLNSRTEREGFVYKSMVDETSFKCISNKFLLKNGD
jgi:RNA ligase (TIGR02306 family)